MPVAFQNFEYAYRLKGKPVFAPGALGRRIGRDIKAQVEAAVPFDPFFYHFRSGGHVAALHTHRHHQYFARVDIERFFYGISRGRVQRALVESGILRARHYAKWSCVRNPYGDPTYSLPYGFVQSPILATLVLMSSGVGKFLRNMGPSVTVSVYMDDISLSSDDLPKLTEEFDATTRHLEEAHFAINDGKTRPPAPTVDLFNCDLTFGRCAVQQARIDEFYELPRSIPSEQAFERYCEVVEEGNNFSIRGA